MLRLTDAERVLFGEKVLDLANVAAGAMVFGQFLADRPFSLFLAFLGVFTWLSLAANVLLLTRSEQQ